MGTIRRLRFALLFGVVGIAGCPAANPPSPDKLYIDFRGRPLPAEVKTSGPLNPEFVRPEPEGLRITLPKDRDELDSVKFDVATAIKGDCEITATIDILEAETPPEGLGVGVFLAVNQAVRVGRMAGANGQQAVVWERWRAPDGTRGYIGEPTPCPDKARRLRLTRIGSVMHFRWSPEATGNDVREIGQCEFGDDDITLVRLIGQTGAKSCRLDIRFIDLRIGDVTAARRPWATMAVGVVAALIVVIVLVAIRRRARKTQAA
jgi:hypothetical protein